MRTELDEKKIETLEAREGKKKSGNRTLPLTIPWPSNGGARMVLRQ